MLNASWNSGGKAVDASAIVVVMPLRSSVSTRATTGRLREANGVVWTCDADGKGDDRWKERHAVIREAAIRTPLMKVIALSVEVVAPNGAFSLCKSAPEIAFTSPQRYPLPY